MEGDTDSQLNPASGSGQNLACMEISPSTSTGQISIVTDMNVKVNKGNLTGTIIRNDGHIEQLQIVNKINEAPKQVDLYTPILTMISVIILVTAIIFGIIMVIPESFIVIDRCDSVPCRNGGKCSTDASGNILCACTSGFSGIYCEQDVIREYFTNRQKDMYKDLKRMTLPIWNNEYEMDILKTFTELDLLKSTRGDERQKDNQASKRRKANSTTLAEVLSVVKSTDSCKVLITGEGGMGKTTILRYIAYNWATSSDDTFAGKFLFLINIRDIKVGENFIDAIIQKINIKQLNQTKNLSKDSIERFLKIHDYEIVLLLDGFDELQGGAENPIQLFEDYDLKKYTVILTSRPENTIDFVKSCDVYVQVKGFSPTNIEKYIRKHFDDFLNMKELGESLIQELQLDSYQSNGEALPNLRNHEEAFELCRSPYLLVMICTIWKEKQSIPKHLPELYELLFCTILNQYIGKSDNKMTNLIYKLDRLPKNYKRAILTLGECMYRGLLTNKLCIDRYDMEAVENNKTIVDLALNIGFVYKEIAEAEYDLREIYTTPHKLLSEALAGFYISIECHEEHLKNDEYEIIRSNEYLHMTRVLAIGFMGYNAGKLLKHWLIIRASNYYSLARYFKYIKTGHQRSVLQVLNENMSTEMKDHVEDMANSFRVYLYGKDTINKDIHLVQLIRTYLYYDYHFSERVSEVIESSEQSSEIICKMIAHISLIQQVVPDSHNEIDLLQIVNKWGDEAIEIISNEWEKHHLNDEVHSLTFSNYYSRKIEIAQMCKILEISPKLHDLYISNCRLSGNTVNAMIEECQNSPVLFELRTLDISYNNLEDVNGALLSKLLKTNKLKKLDMQHCNLNGNIVGDMIKECDRMDIVLKDHSFEVKSNDLSSIDGESLVKLVNVLHDDYSDSITWSYYDLSADNLQDIVNACGENCRFKWEKVDLSDTNLSSVSGTTLANLFKIFPHLTYLNMYLCNLKGNIVGDMIKECDRMDIILKDTSFTLKYNDLSNIDGELIVKLVNILNDNCSRSIKWSDYHLSADNLQDLVKSCGEHCRFRCKEVDLSDTNLSSISGTTLAKLLKIYPYMTYLDISNCDLTGNIVGDMIKECNRMDIVLKDNSFTLEGNDLSNMDGESLVTLVNILNDNCSLSIKWSDYHLSAENLQYLVKSCSENCRFRWKKVDLSNINLSSISGTTLANLFKIFPHLTDLDMSNCSLTGNIVGDMVNKCNEMDVVRKVKFRLQDNDLSNIDFESFVMLDLYNKKWSNYNLSADNLQDLIKSCGENCRFTCSEVDLSDTNLSSISGTTLANLFKIFPYMTYLDISNCNLTGNIIGDMLNECDRMVRVFNYFKLRLVGNDLSNIDVESLVKLIGNLFHNYHHEVSDRCYFKRSFHRFKSYQYENIKWSDYNLSADNLQDLVNSRGVNELYMWNFVILSDINLSSINGTTLANLLKILPDLLLLNMVNCNLTGKIVGDMIRECDRMDIVLKDNSFSLEGNDLSNIYGESLVRLVNALHDGCSHSIKWSYYHLSADNLQDLVYACGENCKFKFKAIDLSNINLSSISDTTLANLFKIFPHLTHLHMANCNLTGNIVGDMIKECDRINNIVLKDTLFILEGNDLSNIDGESLVKLVNVLDGVLKWSHYNLSADNLLNLVNVCAENCRFRWHRVDLSDTNLSSVSGTTLANLFKIFPHLTYLDMENCNLAGNIIGDMIKEYDRMDIVFEYMVYTPFRLEGNDLSNIDGESIINLVNVINDDSDYIKWSVYNLSADNIQDIVNACGDNCRFRWNVVDLGDTNLSSISGITLANLFKIFPHLTHLYMSYCNLAGNIVSDMIKECDRMDIVLKDTSFTLEGNDLSNIDGQALVKFVNVIIDDSDFIKWSVYNLSADNLQDIVNTCGENCRFRWKRVDLSDTNLSSVNGITLANLFKIFPHLTHLDISNCDLADNALDDMLNECDRMGIVLKEKIIDLKNNGLSKHYHDSLATIMI